MSETTIRAALPEDINSMDRLLRELAKTLGEPEAYGGDAGALRDY